MASLLRSGKFIRFFANFTRNITFGGGNRTDPDALLLPARQENWKIQIHRSLATNQLPQRNLNEQEGNAVDRALAKADQEIARIGRLSLKDIEKMLSQIKHLKSVTSQQCALLIRCCGSLVPDELPETRTQLVKDLWNTFENLGVELNVSHFNALLRVYLENEHCFDPLEILSLLEQKNIEPNRVTYQRLVAAYCMMGNIGGASQILEQMKEKNLPINEHVFNALVIGHGRSGDHESANGIVQLMVQAGLEPDVETYQGLLCGYARYGLLPEIQNAMEECRTREVILHDRYLLQVVHEAAVAGHTAVVDDMMGRLRKTTGYNQECYNAVLRLVNAGQDDVAFQILLTMKPAVQPEGRVTYAMPGSFFIRQMAKYRRPTDKIISYCTQMVDQGYNPEAFITALGASNTFNYPELGDAVLPLIKDQKDKLRPSFFWQMMSEQSKMTGESGVLAVLRKMMALECIPRASNLIERVIPHIEDPDNIKTTVRKLRDADVPGAVVAMALLLRSCQRKDFEAACLVAKIYRVRITDEVRHTAAKALVATGDATGFGKLLRLLAGPAPVNGDAAANAAASPQEVAAQFVGPFVEQVVSLRPAPSAETVMAMLQALLRSNLALTSETAEVVRTRLEGAVTEPMVELLDKLTSGESFRPLRQRSQTSMQSPGATERNLLLTHIRNRRLDEALTLKAEMEAKSLPLSLPVQVLLLDLMLRDKRVDEAWQLYTNLRSQEGGLVMDPPKTLRLAAALLVQDRVDDALLVLGGLQKTQDDAAVAADAADAASATIEWVAAAVRAGAWRVLNVVAEKGDVDLTMRLLQIIEESNVTPITNQIIGPTVQVHLVRGDVDGAIAVFEDAVKKRRCTPAKTALMTYLIEKEDAVRLQRIMDLSTEVHGEINSLYDLVFAFLDCGRSRQAKKILETPGLRARKDRLELACKRYVAENRVSELENLVKITRDLFDVDRHMLYDHLLELHIKVNNPDAALGIWTQMQEENHPPREAFLQRLGQFLVDSGREVPFLFDRPAPAVVKASPPNAEPSDAANSVKPKDESGESKKPSLMSVSKSIKAHVEAGDVDQAWPLVVQLLRDNQHPHPPTFRSFVNLLVRHGELQRLRELEPLMNEEMKKMVRFNSSLLATAASSATAAAEFLAELQAEVDRALALASEEELLAARLQFAKSFPIGDILLLLEQQPTVMDQVVALAEAALKLGATKPTNLLWCHHMVNGQKDEADRLWQQVLRSHSGLIFFQPVVRRARTDGNVELLESLVETLSSSQFVTKRGLGVAYSAWIDVCCEKGMTDQAHALLQKALEQDIQLSELNLSTLQNLKRGVEASGQTFPHTLPSQRKKEKAPQPSSSSSSSDSEAETDVKDNEPAQTEAISK